jgi:NADH:ubiquinone oxidoreductase subunit K
MIPVEHILLLGLIQIILGLWGLLLRRAGTVVVVSITVMLNGVLVVFGGGGDRVGSDGQAAGVVILALIVSIAVSGLAVLYAFHRFSKTVQIDEYDGMKH